MSILNLYDIQKKFIRDCSELIKDSKIGIFSSPTGTGKTLSLLLSIKDFIPEYNEEDNFMGDIFGSNVKKSKIYYCSRTHTQLRQVVNEFKKLNIKTCAVVLGSRRLYCINSTVNNLSSLDLINNKCRDLLSNDKCKFYKEHYKENGVFSIEDLVKDSKEKEYCPYYFSKEYFQKSDYVFLPYNLLFDEDNRKTLEINLSNSIVIIDEAHNIVDTVSSINTALIKIEDLKRYLITIIKYKRFLKEHSSNYRLLVTLISIIENLIYFVNENKSKENVLTMSVFLLETKLYNFNTLELVEEINKSNLALKLEGFERNCGLKLQDIIKFIRLLVASDESSRVEINLYYVKIFPLNPKVFFEPFLKVKSLILAGGTMEPSDEIIRMFKPREVVNFVYESSNRMFNCFVLSQLEGKDIEIKHNSREDSELFLNLKDTILNIAESVEMGGIVVFLPSKWYLEKFKKLFEIFINTFFEGSHKFEEYAMSARKAKSILFAVMGGTFSEGINFSDDLCRVLFVIGVPYPNVDVEMEEKIKLFGFEWYTQLAMKKVNQTIGRAIRHEDDYASIILIDKRYTKLKKYLSSWILKKTQVENLTTIESQTKLFFSKK